ncbi:zf-TFIIB domain-containing protein [Xenophilus arseniciresistens]|uniref:Zf-TFIIB domain-containing protein n=1 Tax=Xenophilus arseniciresistens TaxID=1283306 RepID=A0AAE3N5P2_9BURK|nr:zf-TFIIB domain-containing protein [Xenophilus arseniciresistens]MDA7416370.1 zf-TFIIB domain-containing protein [Xenophilus arseniciresistens]
MNPLAPTLPACPSCRNPMEVHQLRTHLGLVTELDICFGCQGIWFDPKESQRLAPEAVLQLFELLHRHRDDAHMPLAEQLHCPHCRRTLAHGFDVVRSGRYVTYRCPQQHGRFTTFSSFMIEKGFVRMLTRPEIEDLARRVDAINCSGCGAPVDIRRDHACPFCRAPFSLLDPQAVDQALKRHGANAAAASRGPVARPVGTVDIADALTAIERDRQRALREEKESSPARADLWSAGLELVWQVLVR